MGKHMCGEKVAGAVVREFPGPDVKAVRERTGTVHNRRGEPSSFVCLECLNGLGRQLKS